MVSERQHSAELQARLTSAVQEKLTVEGARESLKREIEHLKEQLKWHQQQLSTAKEALKSNQMPEQRTDRVELRIGPVERIKDECLDQVTGLHVHWEGRVILGSRMP